MKKKIKVYIGNNLRQIRKLKKMTLVELSQKSGVEVATISRIENNIMSGRIESHIALAEALGVNLESLYKDITTATPNEGKLPQPITVEPHVANDSAYSEILVKDANLKQMLPMIIKIEGGGKTSTEKGMLLSEKFIYVLSGEIELVVGDYKIQLKKDFSYYFNANANHFINNPSKTPARVLCVSTPVRI